MRESSSMSNVVDRCVRARSLSLGAAMGIVLVFFGFSVPLAVIACVKIMTAVDAVMPPPTLAVTRVHPITFVLVAVVIAGLLLGKERVLRSRAATAVNVSTAVLAMLIGAAMLVAVMLPMIMVGKSIAGE